MGWVNTDVARRFAEIAALLELTGADRFRVRAYERAAGAIGALPVDLSGLDERALADLDGIGASSARKITEYLSTGRMAMLEELRAQVPPGVVELTRVPGLGPKTAQALHGQLGIDSVDSLRAAIEGQRLRDLPGLGVRTEERLRDALARVGAKDTGRVPAADVIPLAEELCERLRRLPGVGDVAVAGSLRRMRPTVGDLDLLAVAADPQPVLHGFARDGLVREVLVEGDRKVSVVLPDGLQADVRVVEPASWGAALVYFTGSTAHNVRIRERAVRMGLLLNEYGVFAREGGARIAGRTEAEVYAALGMAQVPPPMREDTGEVEAAVAGELPAVVAVTDLRGDLHGHTDWSGDGKATLEQMVAAAARRGYAYWAATDHAENLSINGLSRRQVLDRRTHIARVQSAHPGLRILDGAELNIGIDGGLDYDDDFLAGFDFCVASIHSHMHLPAAEQTARIVTAMRHPGVHVIGHPTGRKIGMRPGYDIDAEAVVAEAARTGTALEINASPRRLDLSGELVRKAVRAGATLAISTDAHAVGDLDSMRYGVATAVRGWARAADVLNCRDLEALLAFVAAKRAR